MSQHREPQHSCGSSRAQKHRAASRARWKAYLKLKNKKEKKKKKMQFTLKVVLGIVLGLKVSLCKVTGWRVGVDPSQGVSGLEREVTKCWS